MSKAASLKAWLQLLMNMPIAIATQCCHDIAKPPKDVNNNRNKEQLRNVACQVRNFDEWVALMMNLRVQTLMKRTTYVGYTVFRLRKKLRIDGCHRMAHRIDSTCGWQSRTVLWSTT